MNDFSLSTLDAEEMRMREQWLRKRLAEAVEKEREERERHSKRWAQASGESHYER